VFRHREFIIRIDLEQSEEIYKLHVLDTRYRFLQDIVGCRKYLRCN